MSTKIAFFAVMALVASSAHAAVYEKQLQDDATDLQVVSAKQTQVVTDQKVISDGWSNEGPRSHTDYTMAAGLVVTVSYSAEGAFTAIEGDSSSSSDHGEDTIEIPGAQKLVSARIVTQVVTKTVVDDKASVLCEKSFDNQNVDENCEDKIATKSVQAPGKVLQIVTE
jgi:hypothetical protein